MEADEVAPFVRVPGREAQLTGAVSRLCGRDEALATGFAHALLTVVDISPSVSGPIRAQIPRTVEVLGESELGQVKNRRFRPVGGRVDWMIKGDSFRVLVEVKINAGIAGNQLERYLNEFRWGSRTAGGLVLLTRKREPIPAQVRHNRRWLGQVSWDEFIPELKKVVPGDAAVAQEWQSLLATVERAGDLADEPVRWQRGRLTVGQRNRRILRAVLDSSCQSVERALAARHSWRKGDGRSCNSRAKGAQRAVTGTDDHARFSLFLPVHSVTDSVITVEMTGRRRPFRLTVTAPVPPGKRRKRGVSQEVVDKLVRSGFSVDGQRCTVTDRVAPTPGVEPMEAPAQVVRSILEQRLGSLAESGLLDGYARR